MKLRFLFSCLTLFCIHSSGQETKTPFFFDAFSFSINRSDVKDEDTKNMLGFGFGAYHSGFKKKMVKSVFGLEFNQTGQFKKYVHRGPTSFLTDVTYRSNAFSVPLGLQGYFGMESRIFVESAVFVDIALGGREAGISHHSFTDSLNRVVYVKTPFKHTGGGGNTVYGLQFGFGVKIPMKNFDLLVKSDYKLGLLVQADDLNTRYFRVSVGIWKKYTLSKKD